jgi:hypothetical protein
MTDTNEVSSREGAAAQRVRLRAHIPGETTLVVLGTLSIPGAVLAPFLGMPMAVVVLLVVVLRVTVHRAPPAGRLAIAATAATVGVVLGLLAMMLFQPAQSTLRPTGTIIGTPDR